MPTVDSLPLDNDLLAIESSVDRLIAALRTERAKMQHLLKQIGAEDHCNGCKARILWVRHRNGCATPYNADGSPHFASCPKAEHFRRKEKRQ